MQSRGEIMANNDFKFAMDVREELERIEAREEKRKAEIKELQEEIRQKNEQLREETRKNASLL